MRFATLRNSLPFALFVAAFASPASAVEHQVTANPNNTFTPAELVIVAGDSVTWTNEGGLHNVHADDDSFRCADGCDHLGGDGDPALPPWSFTLTFGSEGDIPYHCEVHGAAGGIGMSGLVTVVDSLIFFDGFESGDTSVWTFAVP